MARKRNWSYPCNQLTVGLMIDPESAIKTDPFIKEEIAMKKPATHPMRNAGIVCAGGGNFPASNLNTVRHSLFTLLALLLLAGPVFGADWPSLLATGGDLSYVTNVGAKAYGVHIFTNTGTTAFTPNVGVTVQASYLIVGGGGGGGKDTVSTGSGGGGAGGVVTNTTLLAISSAGTNVTVGGGGGGSTVNSTKGGQGTSSSIGSIVAYGGGGGRGRGDGCDDVIRGGGLGFSWWRCWRRWLGRNPRLGTFRGDTGQGMWDTGGGGGESLWKSKVFLC